MFRCFASSFAKLGELETLSQFFMIMSLEFLTPTKNAPKMTEITGFFLSFFTQVKLSKLRLRELKRA